MSKRFSIARSAVRDVLGYALAAIVSVAIILPLGSFVLVSFVKSTPSTWPTFDNVGRALNMNAGDYWFNSIVIACLVALVGTTLAYFAAYITAHGVPLREAASRVHHDAGHPGSCWACPTCCSSRAPSCTGTLAVLVLVNLVHFFASPYLMAYQLAG